MDASMARHGFQNGLCGCFSAMGPCCTGYWCPCILYGKTNYRLHHQQDPDAGGDYSCCNGQCCLYATLLIVTGFGQAIMQMFQRGQVREQLRINGNGCNDCLASWCCAFCALVQEEREVKDSQVKNGIYAPTQPGMQMGMSYAPQPNMAPQPYPPQ